MRRAIFTLDTPNCGKPMKVALPAGDLWVEGTTPIEVHTPGRFWHVSCTFEEALDEVERACKEDYIVPASEKSCGVPLDIVHEAIGTAHEVIGTAHEVVVEAAMVRNGHR